MKASLSVLLTAALAAHSCSSAGSHNADPHNSHRTFKLEYKFNPGEEYYYSVSHSSLLEDPANLPISLLMEYKIFLRICVQDCMDARADVRIIVDRIKIRTRHPLILSEGHTYEDDSDDETWPNIIGVPILATMTEDGRFANVLLSETMKKRLLERGVKDFETTILMNSLLTLPHRPIAVGEKWSDEISQPDPELAVKLNITNCLDSVSENTAFIKQELQMSFSGPITSGVEYEQAESHGHALFDMNLCRVKEIARYIRYTIAEKSAKSTLTVEGRVLNTAPWQTTKEEDTESLINLLINGADEKQRARAVIKLGRIENAREKLIPVLADIWAGKLRNEQGDLKVSAEDGPLMVSVERTLGNLGADVIPYLAGALEDEKNSRDRLHGIMYNIANNDVESVLNYLGHRNASVRRCAAESLQSVFDENNWKDEYAQRLLRCTRDDDREVRVCIIAALRMPIASGNEDVLSRVLELVNNDNEDVVEECVKLLNTMREIPSNAASSLLSLVKSKNDGVVAQAATALGKLRCGANANVIEALMTCLESEQYPIKRAAATALARIGGPAFPFLCNGLASPKEVVRNAAIAACGMMENELPLLLRAMDTEKEEIRPHLASAIADIAKERRKHHEVLRNLVWDKNEEVRVHAIRGLSSTDEGIEILLSMIDRTKKETYLNCIKGFRHYLESSSCWSIGRLGGRERRYDVTLFSPETYELIVEKLKEFARQEDSAIKEEARKALALSIRAVPEMIEDLRSDEDEIWEPSARGLGRIGERAIAGIMTVLKAKNEKWETRVHAARALIFMKPESLSVLLSALEDTDGNVRVLAVWALSSFCCEKRVVIPKLEEALKDPDQGVQKAARDGLEHIKSLKCHNDP